MKTVEVKGMSCNHCVMAVTKALSALPGVGEIKVDLLGGKATYEESAPLADETVVNAIKKAGFEPGRVFEPRVGKFAWIMRTRFFNAALAGRKAGQPPQAALAS